MALLFCLRTYTSVSGEWMENIHTAISIPVLREPLSQGSRFRNHLLLAGAHDCPVGPGIFYEVTQ